MDKCIACGLCAEKCPKKVDDEYDEGLAKRKAIYVKYEQAVPLKYAIDDEQCIYFTKGKCRACEKFCPTGAINFDDKKKELNLKVGSVILSGGGDTFDPSRFETYQYSSFPNVVTSIEFERLLSASGPTSGHILRPSDDAEPKKIAWLQCVGSRDVNQCDNAYCSSVCCMYAIKEALIAREHIGPDFSPSIFFMDMRTHGKDFEKYYERAKSQAVRFVRSRIHTINEADEKGSLELIYTTESGEIEEELFDMVVLSVGMEPAASAVELARRLDIKLNEYNFIDTEDIFPVASSRKGIYVAGVMQGCKDIPQSIVEASAAACAAGVNLASARKSLVKEKEFPVENDISGQEPRIGVFVCNCGVNIGGIADVPSIVEYSKTLPGVVYAEENLFTCSQDTQDKMMSVIREQGLNRIVVAACTPRTHEPLFQETIRNSGLNPYLFDMANIRNQCTWVHSNNRDQATEKSKDLVRMAVARTLLLEPIPEISVDVNPSALVVGGGIAGMTAALSLADQGFHTTIVEKTGELGGAARDVSHTWKGKDAQAFLEEMINRVKNHPEIDVMLESEVSGASGFVGNFETDVSSKSGVKKVLHGATIIATGGRATDTEEYLYGKNPNVTIWHDIEKDPERLEKADRIVFIQCVGSRVPERPYCSRICCTSSVMQAISIKEEYPDKEVYILYRDMRTFGEREILYRKAREKGVVFIRYSLENKPKVTESGDSLQVTVFDPILQRPLILNADLINLKTAIEPSENEKLASHFKLAMNQEKFFMEAHAKLRPVDFPTEGLYLCGLTHYPKPIEESIAQAMAAASRAVTTLSKSSIQVPPLVSQVDRDKCIGCGLCAEVCGFGAIIMEEVEGKGQRAKNIAASCKGCGLCAASCPQKAIDMLHFRDMQIDAEVYAAV